MPKKHKRDGRSGGQGLLGIAGKSAIRTMPKKHKSICANLRVPITFEAS
jgi:hypothetical protein